MSYKGSVAVGVASMVFVSGGTEACVEARSLDGTSLVVVDMNKTISVVGDAMLWLAVTTTESVR